MPVLPFLRLLATSILALLMARCAVCLEACSPARLASSRVSIEFHCGSAVLWDLRVSGNKKYSFAPPVFPLGADEVIAGLREIHQDPPSQEGDEIVQYSIRGPLIAKPALVLRVLMRLSPNSSIIRFRYVLEAANADGKSEFGRGPLHYFAIRIPGMTRTREVQLSQFQSLAHSYNLQENNYTASELGARKGVMGPILAVTDEKHSLVLAYEHGSTVPESFLQYYATNDRIQLDAAKGNVYPGQGSDPQHPWMSVWFEAGAIEGSLDSVAPVFRRFVLNEMTSRREPRRPYIFYNTWNYQERQKWSAHREYVQSINLSRALEEIEVAHRIGIEVYVLDTGWYQSTGDWKVSPERFPDGLQQIRRKLAEYGMRLGLWFGPTSAAASSQVVREHPEWRASWNGMVAPPGAIWGTEPSYQMCIVSGYSEAFARKVIEVAHATGATYFKWDAVGQHACNDAHHDHGTGQNTPEERDDSYAYQMIGRLTEAASEIGDAIPGAIVDMDVTETGRAFGLGFLSAGKFFLVNNGPYLFDYNLPMDKEKDNWNLFFYPGQARTWIARSPLGLDKWIPSTMLLTHYFPDDPRNLQELNIASMILGQDGIWGDLTAISSDGIKVMAELIARYKQVREDMALSDPVVTGILSGSPEIHEKVSSQTGRGAVVLFATTPGTYEYTTRHRVAAEHWSSGPVTIDPLADGLAHISAEFKEPGARIVYFGVSN
jgi:alpha-galactosidase